MELIELEGDGYDEHFAFVCDAKEATELFAICTRVGGDPVNSARGIANSIYSSMYRNPLVRAYLKDITDTVEGGISCATYPEEK